MKHAWRFGLLKRKVHACRCVLQVIEINRLGKALKKLVSRRQLLRTSGKAFLSSLISDQSVAFDFSILDYVGYARAPWLYIRATYIHDVSNIRFQRKSPLLISAL